MNIPLVGGTYEAYSKAQNNQQCINWFPELVPDGPSNFRHVLYPTPGYDKVITSTGAPRGAHVVGNTPYLVKGTALYSQSSSGVLTSIGTIAGAGRVSMSDDGTKLTITTGEKGYQYDTSTGTLAEITDADFVKTYQHNIYFNTKTVYAGGNGQQVQSSAPLDSDDIDALDFASAEANPDDVQTVGFLSDRLYFFGTKTIEIWQPGTGDFPADKSVGATKLTGCKAQWSVVELDDTLYFLGDDLLVYKIKGYQDPVSVAPPGIAEIIRKIDKPEDATAYGYVQGGHAFYVINFAERTLCYDVTTQLWHERSTWKVTDHTRLNVTHVYRAYGDIWALHEDGNVYKVDPDYFTEGTDMIVRDRISEDIYQEDRRLRQPEFWVRFQPGVGEIDNTIPYAMMRFSDDYGQTWSNELWRSIGKAGEYGRRSVWRRLGSFWQRRFWVRVSSPIRAVVLDAGGEFR